MTAPPESPTGGPAVPTRRFVIDASAVVALLADSGPAGEWVASQALGSRPAAPALMPYEVANVLRRRLLSGDIDATTATLAHEDLLALNLDLYPYEPFGHRVWHLRHNLTAYDASYVALAEALGLPLLTLDARLARADGPRCPVLAYRA